MQQTHSLNDHLWQKQLADGSELTVLQGQCGQQCALALSFASGSHNEPAEYLGAAHFLEHLVFRGSSNFAVDDSLMAFVQRHGGQVNAQTQAQQTLFHFQIQSPLFIAATERLVDMLVSPRLEETMLISEREVLNEEFRLYCQAPQILLDAALAACLEGPHPLQRFYAGNRQTLAIDDAGFSATLRAFHRAAYLRSQLKIVMVIAEDWSHWQDPLLAALQPLIGSPRKQDVLPLPALQLTDRRAIQLQLPVNERYFVVHVPINDNAQGLSELAEKMQHALILRLPQSFLSYAEQQGWCSAITVRAPYVAQNQGVLTLQFKLLAAEPAELLLAWQIWLQQWSEQFCSAEHAAYELQAHLYRWRSADPLRKAQYLLSGGWPRQGVSLECLAALERVLEALQRNAFVEVHAGPEPVAELYDAGLPLNIKSIERSCTAAVERPIAMPCFSFSTSVTDPVDSRAVSSAFIDYALTQQQPRSFPKDRAVCYWGWTVSAPQDVAVRMQARLAPLVEQLNYHAVSWQLEILPSAVFARITGPAGYLPIALNQILTALEQPLEAAAFASNSPFALRRLLQRLPSQLIATNRLAVEDLMVLSNQPQSALWLGAAEAIEQINPLYLQRLKAFPTRSEMSDAPSGWQQVSDSASTDTVLVVYMPCSTQCILEQDQMRAINKVFAQYFQSELQQRLRDELGLCYAVFVMPHTQAEREGLVCAVQSSKVDALHLCTEIRQCLMTFKTSLTERISALHADILLQAQQLEQGAQSLESCSDMLFRHWREQRITQGLQEEVQALRSVSASTIERYHQALEDQSRWLLLSNQASSLQ